MTVEQLTAANEPGDISNAGYVAGQRLKNIIGDGAIAVLMGGEGSERDVSLQSGNAVVNILREAQLPVLAVDVGEDIISQLQKLKPKLAFLALHGKGGEDGTIQAVLERLGIRYTGSGVLASALAMDKIRSKQLWQASNLPTPAFFRLAQDSDFEKIIEQFEGKAFVKPAAEGSSFGMSIATNAEALRAAYQKARQFDANVLAEQFVDGEEYTVALLGERALPAIRIETGRDFYDFQAKYNDDDTSFLIPCGLTAVEEQQLQLLSRQAFEVLGCKGWGRIDVMRDRSSGQFYLLEANTTPGLTSHSLVPMAAAAAGMSFEQLILQIIELSVSEAALTC
jgi:D-alanine-D-alanine ligase